MTYDLVIVGGGINGAGIARDAAMRGLSVCLLEAGDWGQGTSSRSSMLAHGGLRYLEQFELGLVHEALQDRETMFRQAPHLVRPLRFVYPLYPHIANRRTVRVGLWLYDLLSHGKSVPKRGYLQRNAVLAELPGLNPEDLAGAATFWDGQFQNVERFVWELVLDARRHGADCRNHTRVIRLLIEDGVCTGVRLADGSEVQARTVINAAGPWVDQVLDDSLPGRHQLIRKTKGSHLVVPRFTDAALLVRAKDGRAFFVIPWQGYSLIGTTDTDDDGDPADARADAADVAYLVESCRQYFPEAPLDDIRWTYAGIRPLVHEEGLMESAVTRRHRLYDHARDGIRGLWSVQGGKLTTYRHLAEQATTRVARALRRRQAKRARPTRSAALPGGPLVPWPKFREASVAAATQDFGLTPEQAAHIVDAYGAQWRGVLEGAAADGLQRVTRGRPELWAQVDHAVRMEDASHLPDVLLRRTTLGLPADAAVTAAVAARMQALLAWSDDERQRELEAMARALSLFEVPSPRRDATEAAERHDARNPAQ